MKLQQCTKCVLDTTVPNIVFDEKGICNYCHYYDRSIKPILQKPNAEKLEKLNFLLKEIKKEKKKNPYDCLIGVSGGVDSSYLCIKAKEWGLTPLLVHFDNGWNSEEAVNNIENLTKKMHFDLITYVMDWEEFKELQKAYINSSVLDLEVPTDNLINASLFSLAKKHKIRFILSGHNLETESINPIGWTCKIKDDYTNLTTINKLFGSQKLQKLPKLSIYRKYWLEKIFGIQMIALLDFIPYNKEKVKTELITTVGWKDYGWKHFESIFTRFYQGYILPNKGIDKRKMHLSNLIMSNQLTKQEALAELNKEFYPTQIQKNDYEYVLKKLQYSDAEFEEFMKKPIVPHEKYKDNSSRDVKTKFFIFRLFVYPFSKILSAFNFIPTKLKV